MGFEKNVGMDWISNTLECCGSWWPNNSVVGCSNEVLGFGDVLIAKDQKRNFQMMKGHVLTEEHCFHMF